VRRFGEQFDDDLNDFELDSFTVVDLTGSKEVRRGLHAFVAVENLFDSEYDVGRTPFRTIGWPRTVRGGVRLFLP
jgi:outer membrane receptor protein involved in Fe transport